MLSEWQAIVPPAEHGACNVRLADSIHPLDFELAGIIEDATFSSLTRNAPSLWRWSCRKWQR